MATRFTKAYTLEELRALTKEHDRKWITNLPNMLKKKKTTARSNSQIQGEK